MKYPNVAKHIFNTPWLIHPDKMQTISDLVEARMNGVQMSEAEIQAIANDGQAPQHEPGKSIAVLALFGTLMQHRRTFHDSGGTSTETFKRDFKRVLDDSQIGSIIIEVHSPGGQVWGTEELAQTIFDARSRKKIISVVNSQAASAAYWIAAAASEVVITQGGTVGSIGVVTIHFDISAQMEMVGVKPTLIAIPEKKIEGNQFEPLTDPALSQIKSDQSVMFDRFVKGVAKFRKQTTSTVKTKFGAGGMLLADAAVDAGMVDRIGTLDSEIELILNGGGSRRRPLARKHKNDNRLQIAQARNLTDLP